MSSAFFMCAPLEMPLSQKPRGIKVRLYGEVVENMGAEHVKIAKKIAMELSISYEGTSLGLVLAMTALDSVRLSY